MGFLGKVKNENEAIWGFLSFEKTGFSDLGKWEIEKGSWENWVKMEERVGGVRVR